MVDREITDPMLRDSTGAFAFMPLVTVPLVIVPLEVVKYNFTFFPQKKRKLALPSQD